MSCQQLGKISVTSLDFKPVGIVNIYLRIKATKVILWDGEMSMMLFNAMVVRDLTCVVELFGVPISLSAWNKI